jgi:hypothetical protein
MDYNRAAPPLLAERCGYRGGWTVRRRTASNTPATNIMSSQSKAPPPLLLGAVTVSEADTPAALLPAEAVESAFAAIALA